MTEKNFSNTELKYQYINLRSVYKKCTKMLISFEKHVDNLYAEWIIDIATRNLILQKVDELIRKLIKTYNSNLLNILDKKDKNEDFVFEIPNKSVLKNISDCLEVVEFLQHGNKSDDLFKDIKKEMLELFQENGYISMNKFLKFYVGNNYHSLLEDNFVHKYKLYNKVFTPLNIKITNNDTKSRSYDFSIEKISINIDSLMDNTCKIILNLGFQKIQFDGYISADILNARIRTSQIVSPYLFSIKKNMLKTVKKIFPGIDSKFLERYMKMMNSSIYFVNNSNQLAEKINKDYTMFREISTKNFNTIMKDFINTEIKNMFNIINLLLIGNEQNVATATLLFNLLKDKKIGGDLLINIIFRNISYYSQVKIKKTSSLLKAEISRLRSLTPENIPIEKKLASMVNIPDPVKSYIIEKNNEIKTGENSYKLQMAINGLLQFPWKPIDYNNEYTQIKSSIVKSRNFLQSVAKTLNDSVYGHEHSKKVLIELIGKWIQNPDSTGQVIGLVGPPGVGKTLLAKSIGSSLGIPFSVVGLGGMSDSADLVGHSFTYAGAQYGMIVRQMIKAGKWRSVLFFDEVDKVAKRNETNEIYHTLIHITDPNMNQNFQDRFYSSSIDFDLSGVLIVFSYNDSSKLDPILLDRIKEIKISPYSTEEKIAIAQNYIINELCKSIGFNRSKILFHDHVIKYIIENYTQEAGVRKLRRKLEQILLKLNIDRFYMRGPFRKIIKDVYYQITGEEQQNDEISEEEKTDGCINSYVTFKENKFEKMLDEEKMNEIFNLEIENPLVITNEFVHKYLEKPVTLVDKIHTQNMIGIVNGLYATSIGIGGIVPIQIYKNYIGDCTNDILKLKLTGNQKHVMKESVVCALTTAINMVAEKYKKEIKYKFPYGFHIHTPDGGTPKDGPSAGCAFATAFISILIGKEINREIAMTGEIELTGKISKIGGLDIKIVGAKKAGIKCIYICEENRDDYEKIKIKSPEMFEGLEIKIINHIIQIVTDPNVLIGVSDDDFDPIMIQTK